jgi:hypothetical protein
MLSAGRAASAQYAPPQAAVPPGYLPGPAAASAAPGPYGAMFDQTYHDDGTWFRDQRGGIGPFSSSRAFFMNIDYTRTKTRQMRGVFGNSTSQTYFQQNDPNSDGIVDGLAFYNYFNATGPGAIPDLWTNGIRASGGFWNVDGTGLLMDVHWQSDSSATYDGREAALAGRLDTATLLALQQGGGNAIGGPFNLNGQTDLGLTLGQILAPGVPFDDQDANDFGPFGSTFDILDRTLVNLKGIPIDDGTAFGATIPYDIQFLMQHSLTSIGTSADLAFTPLHDGSLLRLNPVVGGRYHRITEAFNFYGIDSGLGYLGDSDGDTPENAKVFPPGDGIDDDDNFIPDNPGEPDGDPEFTQVNPFDPVLVQAYHAAQVRSSLAGPEAGFHYIFGSSKGFSVVGFTKLAAMFNNEDIRISGDNLFNHMSVSDTPNPANNNLFDPLDGFSTNNLAGPTANAYSSTSSSTHVSPLFEQSLTAEVPLFGLTPVLRNMRILEDARLRLGWQFLLIGEIADPVQSVAYQSNPRLNLFPAIRPDRSTFVQHTLSVGINWTY